LNEPPAAIVVAALAAPHDPALDELLGADASAGLRAELLARARRWAAAAAPEHAFEATTIAAAAAALPDHVGPVLLVAPDVPSLGAHHAASALEDLADGLEIVFAPATDGLPFLLAFSSVEHELLDLAASSFEALATTVRTHASGLGMLRAERRLVTPADARALAADPVAPPELTTFLAGALDVRSKPPG
jgi:hypothetical protein